MLRHRQTVFVLKQQTEPTSEGNVRLFEFVFLPVPGVEPRVSCESGQGPTTQHPIALLLFIFFFYF